MEESSNYLDSLKEQLDQEGVFDVLKNSNFNELVLEGEIPNFILEFIGYTNTDIPTLREHEDYEKAIEQVANLQRRLDRTTYGYTSMLKTYDNLVHLRKVAASYVLINVKEVKSLKTTDMRDSAIKYVLKDFDVLIKKLDEFYEIIAQTQMNVSRAINNIKLQLDLHAAKNHMMHSSKITTWGKND